MARKGKASDLKSLMLSEGNEEAPIKHTVVNEFRVKVSFFRL
jgi:hypothetical protein